MDADERQRFTKALHENPVLKEILGKLDADAFHSWKVSGSADEREKLHAFAQAVEKLRSTIYAANAGNPNAR